MSKKQIIVFLSILISFIFLWKVFAEDDKITLQYIQNIWNNSYRLIWTWFWTDISALKIFLNWKEMNNVTRTVQNGNFEISNLMNVGWDLSIQKTISKTESWTTTTSTITSNSIKYVKEDKTVFKDSYKVESIWWKYIWMIPFFDWYSDWQKFNQYWITEKTAVVNVNWTDYNIDKDIEKYDDWKYYYNKDYLLFPVINLTKPVNYIRLKFDWLYSNYIVIKREFYPLSKPKEVTIEDYSSTKYIKFIFDKPTNLVDLTNMDAYVNGNKVSQNDFTLSNSNVMSIRYEASKFWVDDKVARINLQNNLFWSFSNNVYVNIVWLTENRINKVDLWDGKSANLNLKFICTSIWGFMWDLSKIKLYLNDKEYSEAWVSETVKTSTWADARDGNWNLVYQTNRKIKFLRSWNEISTDFFYSNFGTWTNVMYIKNENTWRESNRVSFNWKDYYNINYDYKTSNTNATTSSWETLVYEVWTNISAKNIDFLSNPDRDINLWKINFNNLTSNNFYKIYFKLTSNLNYNPFYSLKIWNYELEPVAESNWNISFVFNNNWYGKDFTSGNIVANLNESRKQNSPIKFIVSWLNISKYNNDSNLETIYSNNNTTYFNLSYNYDFWACFDWWKDYCSLSKLNKPSLVLNLVFDWDLKATVPVASNTQSWSSQIGNTKKNSPIVILNFKTSKFKTYNNKFAKLYDDIKAKNITVRQATTLKNSINNILKALKNSEDNISKQEANIIIKNNIKTILEIIKSTKK